MSVEPVPFQIVDTPRQLKAFTDPLRNRILAILAQRAATNQQLAAALGEPEAKVLHHVRFLLEVGLIRLVETRVRGGNVEKYYRAVARAFGLRPPNEQYADLAVATLEAIRQQVAASTATWPDQPRWFETRKGCLAPARAAEFYQRLLALLGEYWPGPAEGGGATAPHEDPNAPLLEFACVMYRDPTDAGPREAPSGEENPDDRR